MCPNYSPGNTQHVLRVVWSIKASFAGKCIKKTAERITFFFTGRAKIRFWAQNYKTNFFMIFDPQRSRKKIFDFFRPLRTPQIVDLKCLYTILCNWGGTSKFPPERLVTELLSQWIFSHQIFRGSQAYKYTSISGIFSSYDHFGPSETIFRRHTGIKPCEIGSKAIFAWSRYMIFVLHWRWIFRMSETFF